MDSSASVETHHDPHAHAGEHEHHELGWWRKYIFSTDHKVIGIQYGLCGLSFLFLGFCLMMLMRFQLAYPGQALPLIGKFLPHIFGPGSMPDGKMTPDFYNSLGAMHGTIMIFAGVVPLAFAAFGNFVVPLQIGAPDMTFPKVNAASFWAFGVGGVIMLISFFVPGGPAKSGWTSYTPLADISDTGPGHNPLFNGQTLWLIGFIFLISSSLLGAINFITTIIQLRAKGLTWMRLPFFVWAQFVTAFLLLLAFPPLEAAIVMQLMDRVAHTSFFLPSGLVVNGAPVSISGGGSPLLWQHLFWFLGHPEVYVLILPAFGIVAEILANNSRKPLWGYKSLVFSVLVIGFLSFIVWAHHMWLTGMGSTVSAFFQTTTLLISIPSVIILSAFFISLWGGSIRFTVPMLWATAFLPMFGIGGLTGIPLAFNSADLAGAVDHVSGANSVHHQFLLEHQARQKSERQSVGSDHSGMHRPFTSAARKLRHYSGCLPRAIRIQPARSRKRFHHAKRTGRTGRSFSASGRTGIGALTNDIPVHHIHPIVLWSVECEVRHLVGFRMSS